MDQVPQATTPIIPVIDASHHELLSLHSLIRSQIYFQERLAYLPEAPLDHKAKIDQYNELLEDVYQREVELSRFKSALTNMRQEITEEVVHLSSTGVLPPVASATPVEGSKSDSESDAENVLSDSTSGSTGDSKAVRRPMERPAARKPNASLPDIPRSLMRNWMLNGIISSREEREERFGGF
jgi:hypothetical protein